MKGERVLGENIVDNGGFKIVYMVYRYWFKLKDLNEVKDFFGLILILE